MDYVLILHSASPAVIVDSMDYNTPPVICLNCGCESDGMINYIFSDWDMTSETDFARNCSFLRQTHTSKSHITDHEYIFSTNKIFIDVYNADFFFGQERFVCLSKA